MSVQRPAVELSPGDVVRADFDRIARLDGDVWDHNSHYHGFLLDFLPPRCGEALDLGCGTGGFSRLLAGRCAHVLALDLSPEMIRVAGVRSASIANITYQVADAL